MIPILGGVRDPSLWHHLVHAEIVAPHFLHDETRLLAHALLLQACEALVGGCKTLI